jgi:hypothetical protein
MVRLETINHPRLTLPPQWGRNPTVLLEKGGEIVSSPYRYRGRIKVGVFENRN